MAGAIEIRCAICETPAQLNAEATSLACSRCKATFTFRHCEHCGAVEQVGPNAAFKGRECKFCFRQSTVGRKAAALAVKASSGSRSFEMRDAERGRIPRCSRSLRATVHQVRDAPYSRNDER